MTCGGREFNSRRGTDVLNARIALSSSRRDDACEGRKIHDCTIIRMSNKIDNRLTDDRCYATRSYYTVRGTIPSTLRN